MVKAKQPGPLNKIIEAIKNKVSRIGNQPTVESGNTGTNVYNGIITEDFNPDMQFPQSIETFDKMRKGDGTVAGLLEAMKQPIISAKWAIRASSEDSKDIEVANFINYALFNRINFKGFLEEALTFNDFGFKYFEKVFVQDGCDPKYPGFIFWKKFASRLQTAHYKWGIDGEKWKDDTPTGVTQQIMGFTDEVDELHPETYPTIPWEKLILFTRKREGNNFEGISCLRAAYKHWFFLDMLYKVASVSAERYGVGFPWAKTKAGAGKPTEAKLDEMLGNIRSQEQSFVRLNSDVEDWGIMTPNGDAKAGAIQGLIDHHTKKLYDCVLAGFLNLTGGDGGSNAMSRDQSSFFLQGLRSQAEYFREIMQDQIDELVKINFVGIKNPPTLTVTNIGTISIDEIINSMVNAKEGGLLTSNPNDENAVREILDLQPLPEKDAEDLELDKLENEMDILQMQVLTMDNDEPEEDSEGDMEEEPQDGPSTVEEENASKEELCEFFGDELGNSVWKFVGSGESMPQEQKDKIAEALRKKSEDTIENDISNDTQVKILSGTKQSVLQKLAAVRAELKAFREKSQSLDTKAKKAFNKQMKETIAAMKAERDQLIQDRINVNSRITTRKKEVGAMRKERKLQDKIKKTIEREEAKIQKKKEKEKKDAQKKKEKQSAISQKIKDLQGNKDATDDPDKKENIQIQIDKQQDKLDKLNLAEGETLPTIPTTRENAFLQSIDEYEKFLDFKFNDVFIPILEKYEGMYSKGLIAIYEASDTEMIDGVTSLKYDPVMIKKGEDFVDKITKKFETELIGSPLEKELFDKTKVMALKTLKKNSMYLAEDDEEDDEEDYEDEDYYIDEARFTSYRRGYISNLLAWLFNEPRRLKEAIIMNYGSQISIKLAIKQADGTSFNKNVYKLSVVTHPRTAFQGIIFDNANKEGFTHYKVVVPPSKLEDLNMYGRTAGLLYFIGTAAVINNMLSKQTDGANPDAVKGMGIGHGSFEYYYPIDGGDLEEEEAIAEAQKQEFFEDSGEMIDE